MSIPPPDGITPAMARGALRMSAVMLDLVATSHTGNYHAVHARIATLDRPTLELLTIGLIGLAKGAVTVMAEDENLDFDEALTVMGASIMEDIDEVTPQ